MPLGLEPSMSNAVSSPFDDILRLITTMPGPDEAAVEAVRLRDQQLTKPAGSLGRLERIAEWLAAWQAKSTPSVDRPLVCVFAASHGVTARGVSAFPSDVNRQMLENFAAGGQRPGLQGVRPRHRHADRRHHRN